MGSLAVFTLFLWLNDHHKRKTRPPTKLTWPPKSTQITYYFQDKLPENLANEENCVKTSINYICYGRALLYFLFLIIFLW